MAFVAPIQDEIVAKEADVAAVVAEAFVAYEVYSTEDSLKLADQCVEEGAEEDVVATGVEKDVGVEDAAECVEVDIAVEDAVE